MHWWEGAGGALAQGRLVLGRVFGGAARRLRARVQSTLRPKMRWIIECGINTANKLGTLPPTPTPHPHPLKREKKKRDGLVRKSGEGGVKRRDGGGGRGVRENPSDPLGGKAAIEKLLNLHLAGLIGNEEAY